MKVEFTYDYSIGRHEVTCGEFNQLMNGESGLKVDCKNDSLPAIRITYYDAVLFSNAKSKAGKLDTAYTYTAATFDKNGNCINLIRLDVESAAIPRWRVINGDTTIVYVNDAGTNDDQSTFLKNSTWQVSFANGKFGTPKKLLNGAYHDGISADERLAISGARLLRSHIASSDGQSTTDSIWYNGEQACNASLSHEASKQILFLDFAGPTGTNFVGERYNVHKYILIADSIGNLQKAIPAPNKYTSDHSEWSVGDSVSSANFAVATLTNNDGNHQKIVLVNAEDGSTTELIEGDELWHPCLWLSSTIYTTENTELDPDSAGIYYTSAGGEAAIILRYDMSLLWKYKDEVDVIFLGSSRPSSGADPYEIDTMHNALNLTNYPVSYLKTI